MCYSNSQLKTGNSSRTMTFPWTHVGIVGRPTRVAAALTGPHVPVILF